MTTSHLNTTKSRKRVITSNGTEKAVSSFNKKRRLKQQQQQQQYDVEISWQQLINLATAAANHHYTPIEPKRQKKDFEWPSLQSISQIQAPDNWNWDAENRYE